MTAEPEQSVQLMEFILLGNCRALKFNILLNLAQFGHKMAPVALTGQIAIKLLRTYQLFTYTLKFQRLLTLT